MSSMAPTAPLEDPDVVPFDEMDTFVCLPLFSVVQFGPAGLSILATLQVIKDQQEGDIWFPTRNFSCYAIFYYAPPSRPEGPRRCPDMGKAGGALVFSMLLWLLYTMGVYTYPKIHLAKLGLHVLLGVYI